MGYNTTYGRVYRYTCARQGMMSKGLSVASLKPDPTGMPGATLQSESAAHTRRLGALLGGLLRPGDVALLDGPLGAGKTALTQGIGAGLGVAGTINSPTFTLLKEYSGRLPLYHFDLYRIEDPEELFALGFEDYFGGEGVCVVEWADRGIAADGATPWPADWLRIAITPNGATKRTLTCSAVGTRGTALLRAFMAEARTREGR